MKLGNTEQALDLVADGTLLFVGGDDERALGKIEAALALDGECFEGWLAKAEVYYSQRKLDEALEAAERALGINKEDVYIHTTLSRIWIERGEKEKAEHHGLQARRLGWKEYIRKGKRVCKT